VIPSRMPRRTALSHRCIDQFRFEKVRVIDRFLAGDPP
jgi:hypothetical protein